MAFVSNGTTIADAGAFSASLGSMVLIKTLTASSSATLSFVNGSSSVVLDGTYPIYKFVFINMHPETNGKGFGVNFSDDTSSHSYDLTKTSSVIETYHAEDGSESTVGYQTVVHLAQSTGIQYLTAEDNVGNGNDECANGEIYLFNPASTTYIKHYSTMCSYNSNGTHCNSMRISGYINTTAAVTAAQFKFKSGNIDAGTIKLYGIKDS